MQYMAIIYTPEPAGPDPAVIQAYGAYTKEMREKGYYQSGRPLKDQSTAKCVSVRNGKISMRDGPFSETKEQLAGFFLLDCPSIEVALECCAKIPGARIGSVEVRPVGTRPPS